MSKKWKIVLSVLAGLVVLVFVVIVGVVLFAGNYIKSVAQEVYGGKLQKDVIPVIGLTFESDKLAVFTEAETGLVMVIAQSPAKGSTDKPLSEENVKKALGSYTKQGSTIPQAMKGVTEGIENAEPSTLKLGKETIHTLKYTSAEGKPSKVGVLNLDNHQLVFMATSEQAGNGNDYAMFSGSNQKIKFDASQGNDSVMIDPSMRNSTVEINKTNAQDKIYLPGAEKDYQIKTLQDQRKEYFNPSTGVRTIVDGAGQIIYQKKEAAAAAPAATQQPDQQQQQFQFPFQDLWSQMLQGFNAQPAQAAVAPAPIPAQAQEQATPEFNFPDFNFNFPAVQESSAPVAAPVESAPAAPAAAAPAVPPVQLQPINFTYSYYDHPTYNVNYTNQTNNASGGSTITNSSDSDNTARIEA